MRKPCKITHARDHEGGQVLQVRDFVNREIGVIESTRSGVFLDLLLIFIDTRFPQPWA